MGYSISSTSESSSGIRSGLLRKRRERLSDGISLAKSGENRAGAAVVVGAGGGRVGQVCDSVSASSVDSNSTP